MRSVYQWHYICQWPTIMSYPLSLPPYFCVISQSDNLVFIQLSRKCCTVHLRNFPDVDSLRIDMSPISAVVDSSPHVPSMSVVNFRQKKSTSGWCFFPASAQQQKKQTIDRTHGKSVKYVFRVNEKLYVRSIPEKKVKPMNRCVKWNRLGIKSWNVRKQA